MSKEKQIEEMAKALTKYEKGLCERLPKDQCLLTSAVHAQVSCDYCKIAEFLYNAGYRKQSEWISVEDRLPEFEHWQTIVDVPFPIPTPIKVLCAFQTKDGYIIREGTYEINDGLPYFRVIGRVAGIVGITHWMPLPEAPKMKGGEEQ